MTDTVTSKNIDLSSSDTLYSIGIGLYKKACWRTNISKIIGIKLWRIYEEREVYLGL
jgi:hypothetical protein